MKVAETYVSLSKQIDVGRFSFFIRIEEDGANVDMDNLVAQGAAFPRIIITGKEPFLQKEDLSKFIKKVTKRNPNTVVEIITKGTIRPIGLASLNNVLYTVCLQLKNTGKDYSDRIDETTLKWFIESNSNFLFKIDNADDVDEANMIINNHGIKKSKIYLAFRKDSKEIQLESIEKLLKYAKRYGYNIAPDFGLLFWENDGRY